VPTKIGRSLLLLPLVLFAGELNFVASVNRTEVGVGEPLLLTVSVEGEDMGQVPAPSLPDLPDFDIGSTSTSQSTNIQMVGGKIIRRQFVNFIYTLYPKEIGKAVIGSCRLEFKNETYQTQPIEITVVKGAVQQIQPRAASPAPSGPGVSIDDNLKLVATASRRSVFQGEQVIVEYTLYTRLRLADINLSEAPSFSGFWVEPIFDAQQIQFQPKTIDGKLYNISLLRKVALFPVTTGRLVVAPMKLDVAVVQSPRDIFDIFSTTKVVPLASDVIYVDVAPLPVESKPEEFAGAVGRFSMSAALDRSVSEAAEPINLTVRISGSGNIKLIEKPLIPSIPGVKILDPEVVESTDFSGGSIKGHKEFRFPLIPQTDGEHIIPPIKMAYFDPVDRQYHTVDTERLKFTATRTSAAVEIARAGELKVVGSDVRYIKPNVLKLKSQNTSADWWLVLLYIASLAAIVAASVYRQHQARLLTDQAYARKSRSSRILRKRLKEAEQHLKEHSEKAFHAALSRVLLGYIGDRYNLDVGSMTNEDITEELKQRDVSEDTVRKITDLLNECDMRFSPGMRCADPNALFNRVKRLLSEI